MSDLPNSIPFTEVPSSTIRATEDKKETIYSTTYKTDFSLASKEYWIGKTGDVESYKSGIMIGNLGKNDLTISGFFDKIYTGLREAILIDLRKNNKSSEHIKSQLIILEHTLKLLAKELNTNDKENINMVNMLAVFHGFINSYIESVNR